MASLIDKVIYRFLCLLQSLWTADRKPGFRSFYRDIVCIAHLHKRLRQTVFFFRNRHEWIFEKLLIQDIRAGIHECVLRRMRPLDDAEQSAASIRFEHSELARILSLADEYREFILYQAFQIFLQVQIISHQDEKPVIEHIFHQMYRAARSVQLALLSVADRTPAE